MALTVSTTCPRNTSCEVRSLPGLSSIGLNRTLGARPAARACMACARPISPPSTVTAELLDMFCALNGATRIPLRDNSLHRPATTIDFPASDVVPATSSAPLIAGLSRMRNHREISAELSQCVHTRRLAGEVSQLGQDLGAVVGDHQRVLEL